jgi:predicted ATP-dependent serine protease
VVAVVSSLREVVLDPHLVVFGEVGLTGEVRAVGQVEARLREAAKLGFRRCLLPQANGQLAASAVDMALCGVRTVAEALQVILPRDPAAALDAAEDAALATTPVRMRSWGKRNERALGY